MNQPSPSSRYDDLSPEAIAAHDRQRVMPPDIRQELISRIRSRLGRGTCLDAGAGTGAIAIPLSDTGTPVIALDISRSMLRECQRQRGSRKRLVLVRGDIMHLPFRTGAFAGVHCAHTLHLVDDWQEALREMIRVTRRGGALLFGLGRDRTAPPEIAEIQHRFWKPMASLVNPPESIGLASEDVFHAVMLELGSEPQQPIVVTYQDTITPGQEIDRLERNVFARPTGVDAQHVRETARMAQAWAAERFGSLDKPLHRLRTLTYHVYRKPSMVLKP